MKSRHILELTFMSREKSFFCKRVQLVCAKPLSDFRANVFFFLFHDLIRSLISQHNVYDVIVGPRSHFSQTRRL